MMRLFVGLALPESVRTTLVGYNGGIPDARWISAKNLHLTLRFIGDAVEDIAEDIDTALTQICAPAFKLSLAGLDCFQSRGKVRAVWIGGDGGEALPYLQNKVESALVRTGIPVETRKFTPHITLARFNRAPISAVAPYIANYSDIYVPDFEVRYFSLFLSHLGQAGAEYQILADYPLS